MSFSSLKLHQNIMDALEKSGFSAPTAIQREAVPVLMSGRDLMASAQTGTGKTAAFVLPTLHRLLTSPAGPGIGPRVLVLTPTRELASQVNENIRQFGRFCKLTNGTVVGGMAYPPQQRLLSQPLDILVATPGRLMDHMARGRVDFSRLEVLILDEADRMLDMGFVDAVKKIAAATPPARQTLLFSATLEGKVLTMAKQLLRDPARIQLAANRNQHASISQCLHRVDSAEHKQSLLAHYLSSGELEQAIIFTATTRGADKLARALSGEGHASAALHGDMGQGQRKRTVENVRRRKVKCLVATDVAARGLDIRGITHVINFDMPMVAEDYIHRIGRTGRGGESGRAISLVAKNDSKKLASIERLTGQRIARTTIPGLEPRMRHGDRRTEGTGPKKHDPKRAGKGRVRNKQRSKGRAHKGGQPSLSA